ncbi:MAG: hypothetical protein AABY54_05160, partial [Deltaproteobacteria bacterium]
MSYEKETGLAEILSRTNDISEGLNGIQGLLSRKSIPVCPQFDINCSGDNYAETLSKLRNMMLKVRKGLENGYFLPLPQIPDTLHWEIMNEFVKYFASKYDIVHMAVDRPPGFKSKRRADLFFVTSDDKWYWVEVQTTLTSETITSKIKDAIWWSDHTKDRYAEYILVFPKEFAHESLFLSTITYIKGNTHTNKRYCQAFCVNSLSTGKLGL